MDAQGMEGEEWDELQRNLMATIPVYDRINRFATLGQVSRWRKMVRERSCLRAEFSRLAVAPEVSQRMWSVGIWSA